jgi:hypothetical protein
MNVSDLLQSRYRPGPLLGAPSLAHSSLKTGKQPRRPALTTSTHEPSRPQWSKYTYVSSVGRFSYSTIETHLTTVSLSRSLMGATITPTGTKLHRGVGGGKASLGLHPQEVLSSTFNPHSSQPLMSRAKALSSTVSVRNDSKRTGQRLARVFRSSNRESGEHG